MIGVGVFLKKLSDVARKALLAKPETMYDCMLKAMLLKAESAMRPRRPKRRPFYAAAVKLDETAPHRLPPRKGVRLVRQVALYFAPYINPTKTYTPNGEREVARRLRRQGATA